MGGSNGGTNLQGTPFGGWSMGNDFNWHNPSQQPLSGQNRFADDALNNYNSFAQQYTDPARFATLQSQYGDVASSQAMNQYAAQGLAGSGAAIGAANNARLLSNQSLMNTALNANHQAAGTNLDFLNYIQGGANAYQNDRYAAWLNNQQATKDANRSTWNGITSFLGGAMGGMSGGGGGFMGGMSGLMGGGG